MGLITWLLQILLAVAFIGAGFMKLTTARQRLMERMEWVRTMSATTVKVIGGLELLGGIGLLLPSLIGIAPWLAPTAAICLAVVMALAIGTHLRLHEPSQALPAIVLLALLLITIIGLFHTGRA